MSGFLSKLRCRSRMLVTLLLVVLLFLLSGCIARQTSLQGGMRGYPALQASYQKKAKAYESKGLYPEAIESWQIVLLFQPGDLKVQQKINKLQKKARGRAGAHFDKGVSFYKKGQLRQARREFLLALAYEPDHGPALNYLKKKLQKKVLKTYVVRAGDSLQQIAKKEYKDPGKGALIASFNDLKYSDPLRQGMHLQLPVLGRGFLAKGKAAKGMVEYGDQAPASKGKKNKRSKGTEPSPKDLVSHTKAPGKVKAKIKKQSLDADNYRKAKNHLAQEEYQKALRILNKIDVNYRDTGKLKASTEVFVQQEADAHYRKGISYFLSEDLDKAIAEWQEVLRLSPGHLKAKKDLKNARKMQKRVKTY